MRETTTHPRRSNRLLGSLTAGGLAVLVITFGISACGTTPETPTTSAASVPVVTSAPSPQPTAVNPARKPQTREANQASSASTKSTKSVKAKERSTNSPRTTSKKPQRATGGHGSMPDGGMTSGETQLDWLCKQGIASSSDCN